MTSEQRLQQEIDRQERDLQTAIKNGGLPSEADAEAVEKNLGRVYDQIESLVWRVEGIANGTGTDVPFPVTLDHVGVLAIMASDIEGRADDLQHFAKRLRDKLVWIDSIRVAQKRASDG